MSNPFSEAFSDLRKPYLAEELPARKFKPTAAPKAEGGGEQKGSAEGNSDKKIRQAVYDIRYRARREDIPLESAFSQYMANTSMSDVEKKAVRGKLFGGGETKAESADPYLEEEMTDTKYQVRVTDKNGKSYVRMANRTKIGELRANPNISSVEMTNYGTPYEGERRKGKQTAAVKAGKSLDPVGKEDGDVDNDGKKNDSNDKYIMKRRAAIGKAIGSRMKESFEINDSIKNIAEIMGSSSNNQKVNPKKGIKNEVTINPELGESVIAYEEVEIESMSEFQEAMTASQKNKREDIVKGMKRNFADMKGRYGARAKDVMYATATKMAMKDSYDPEAVDEGAGKLAAGLATGIAGAGMFLAGKAKETAEKMKKKKEAEINKQYESYDISEESDESDFAESIEEAVMVLNLKKGPVEPQSGPSGPCDCCGKDPCECEGPRSVESDPRMARNKARAMGLKMSYEPEGDLVDEGSCGSSHSKPKKKKVTTEEVEQIDEVLGKIAAKLGCKLVKAAGKFVDKQIASTTAKSVAKAKPKTGGAKIVYKPSKPSNVKYGGNTPAAKPAEAPKRLASVKDVADDPWTKGAISRDDVMRARRDMRAAQGK